MDIGFPEALLLLGLVLAAASGLSGLMHGTVLSISVLSVVAGIGLSLAGVISVQPGAEVVLITVQLALLLTLFSDGLVVENELLQSVWRAPARALAFAMPITLALIACAAKLLFDALTWPETLLLGARCSLPPIRLSPPLSSLRNGFRRRSGTPCSSQA